MKIQGDILQLIRKGKIENELDFERALIADRKLRLLSSEDSRFKKLRRELRKILEKYESSYWGSQSQITDEKIEESNNAELIAENERLFIQNRKLHIRKKLNQLHLTQQDLGKILGHNSKSYMSELINGISPFTIRDLVVINRLLGIELIDLVPTFLSQVELNRIEKKLNELNP